LTCSVMPVTSPLLRHSSPFPKECVCCCLVQGRRVNDRYRDRQTNRVAMSPNLLPERHCSKTYTTHIFIDSLILCIIVHRSSISCFLARNNYTNLKIDLQTGYSKSGP
jgi:hypothetical protein